MSYTKRHLVQLLFAGNKFEKKQVLDEAVHVKMISKKHEAAESYSQFVTIIFETINRKKNDAKYWNQYV